MNNEYIILYSASGPMPLNECADYISRRRCSYAFSAAGPDLNGSAEWEMGVCEFGDPRRSCFWKNAPKSLLTRENLLLAKPHASDVSFRASRTVLD